jgi:hypothetical protein
MNYFAFLNEFKIFIFLNIKILINTDHENREEASAFEGDITRDGRGDSSLFWRS